MTGSFRFYDFFAEAASDLDDEQYGALMRAINEYVFMGKLPKLQGAPKMIFTLVKPYLDNNGDSWL